MGKKNILYTSLVKGKTRYQQAWGELSHKLMYILRHQLPQMPVKKVAKGGWVKLEAIKEL